MVLVSNFTIGKPDARATTYRLQITNLEDIPLEFLFEAHVTLGGGDPVGPIADSLSLRVYHFRQGISPISSGQDAGEVRYSSARSKLRTFARIWLPAGASGLVVLGYSLVERVRIDDTEELSGYTTLRVPPARLHGRFELGRQIAGNARVLLHASHVSYRPAKTYPSTDLTGRVVAHTATPDDADAEGITLASGKAENEIEAEGWMLGDISDFLEQLHDGTIEPDALAGARHLSDEDLAPALLDLLAGLADDHDGIAALNTYLDRSESKLRIETRD